MPYSELYPTIRFPLPLTGPFVEPDPETTCTLMPLNWSVVPSNEPICVSLDLQAVARNRNALFPVVFAQITLPSAAHTPNTRESGTNQLRVVILTTPPLRSHNTA